MVVSGDLLGPVPCVGWSDCVVEWCDDGLRSVCVRVDGGWVSSADLWGWTSVCGDGGVSVLSGVLDSGECFG